MEASGLKNVRIEPALDDRLARVLILTDTKGTTSGYIINPECVNALLTPLLRLPTNWADEPSLEVEELTGPQHALPAQRIRFARGRTPQECAVRVGIGG